MSKIKWKINDFISIRRKTSTKKCQLKPKESSNHNSFTKLKNKQINFNNINSNELIKMGKILKSNFEQRLISIRYKNNTGKQTLNLKNVIITKKLVKKYTRNFKEKFVSKNKNNSLKQLSRITFYLIYVLKLINEFNLNINFIGDNMAEIFPKTSYLIPKSIDFFKAIQNSSLEKLKELLKENILLKFQINNLRMNCIHVSVKLGNLNIWIYLLSQKCNLKQIDIYNKTPLFYSFYKYDFKIQIILLIFKLNPFVNGNIKGKFYKIDNEFYLENIEVMKNFWLKYNIYNRLKYKKYDLYIPKEFKVIGEEVIKIYKNVNNLEPSLILRD